MSAPAINYGTLLRDVQPQVIRDSQAHDRYLAEIDRLMAENAKTPNHAYEELIDLLATLIAKYGKPVGLVVWNGRHAVVMTGFTSTRNPTRGGSFSVLKVTYSDPIGSRHATVAAAYSPLNRYLEMDATTTYDRLWYGKYIIVAPQN